MINKIYKIINNKYSRFLKFFFFLRYVFAIFLIAIFLFLLIPKFFNYGKKEGAIKDYLVSFYDLELASYSSIEFNVFPAPNLSIKDTILKVKDKPISLTTESLNIYLNLKNIYNYENFEAKKILLNKNKIDLGIDKTRDIFNYFAGLKYKINIQDLNLNFIKKKKSILEIKKIDFSNYGYKKNNIQGEVFGKIFKAYLSDDYKNLNFKILNTGISADFKFLKIDETDSISGTSKIRILDNHLRFNFDLENNRAIITKSNLRNQDLSVSFDSIVAFDPFFEINSDIKINKVGKKLIESLNLEKIIKNQEILKKLNSNSKINYSKKSLLNTLIKKHSSEVNLAHGRLTFFTKIYILKGDIDCKGESLLIEEYPRLNFVCLFNIEDKKRLLKKFSISKDINNDAMTLDIEGSLNLLNKKINFKTINFNKNSAANEEDIKYFKETFENILFDGDFFEIFRMNKIKEFLLEVI